jgi:O-antigen/teichoic acid export membrane protein
MFMIESESVDTSTPVQPREKSEKNEQLTQRAYLNVVTALLGFVAAGGTSLLINPFLVRGLGNVHYGVLQIVQQMTTFMTAADGRPTQALKWFIANLQGGSDHTKKRHAIGSAIGIWLFFVPVLLIAGGIMVWFSPLIARVPTNLNLVVQAATALYVFDILVSGFATLPDAVIKGMNMGYKRMMLTPFFILLGGVLTVGAIFLGMGVPGVAAAALITDIIMGVVWWSIIRKLLPWFGVARPDMDGLRRFIGVSGWFFGWTLVNKVILNGDIVVLGMVAGPEVVTTFTLTGYVARMVIDLSALALGSITPGLGLLISQEKHKEVLTIRHEMLIINWLLCISIGVSILLWNRSFLGLWVGLEYYGGIVPNLMIVLTVLQLTFIRNDAFIIDLTLNLRNKVLLGGMSALLSLGLAASLIRPLGIAGLCLGLLVGRSILSTGYPLIVGSTFGFPWKQRLHGMARPALTTALMFFASAYLSQFLLVENWFQFMAYGSATFAAACVIALVIGLTLNERKAIIARVGKVRLFGRVSL